MSILSVSLRARRQIRDLAGTAAGFQFGGVDEEVDHPLVDRQAHPVASSDQGQRPARSRHGVARPLLGAPELRVLLGAEPPQRGLGGWLDRVGRDELAPCHGAPELAPDRHVIG
jgi:hypothetical protein